MSFPDAADNTVSDSDLFFFVTDVNCYILIGLRLFGYRLVHDCIHYGAWWSEIFDILLEGSN